MAVNPQSRTQRAVTRAAVEFETRFDVETSAGTRGWSLPLTHALRMAAEYNRLDTLALRQGCYTIAAWVRQSRLCEPTWGR